MPKGAGRMTCRIRRIAVVNLVVLCLASTMVAHAADGPTVTVSTVDELQAAVQQAGDNTTIAIAPGTYHLTNTLHFRGPAKNVVIRGTTGNPRDVVLMGRGMTNKSYGTVPHGILVDDLQDMLIADLTIRDVYYHPITFQAHAGCQRPHVYNCRLINAGEQFIKSNPNPKSVGGGVDGGIVEFTVMEFETTARDWYTNGVDVLTGKGWTIRHCLFRNIRTPPDDKKQTGPAVLMWQGCADTLCESNLFINCEANISFGMIASERPDHSGGIIRNNIIFRGPGSSGDTGIAVWNSPGTKVLHNTVILSGTFPNAIESRFASTTNCLIAYNLCDGNITQRDGAQATLVDNITRAIPSWFVDATGGNLHLTETAANALLKAKPCKEVTDDFDGQPRPADGLRNLGADQYTAEAPEAKKPLMTARRPAPTEGETPTTAQPIPARRPAPTFPTVQKVLQGRQLVYDAIIDPEWPKLNFGRTAMDNRLRRRKECSALLLRFPLKKLRLPPAADVVGATVSFYVWDPSPSGKMKVCAMELKTAWDEVEATWQRPKRGARWKGGQTFVFGVDTGPAGQAIVIHPNNRVDRVNPPIEYRLDATDIVRGWLSGVKPNHGLAIAPVIDEAIDNGLYSRIQIVGSESRQPRFVPKLTLTLRE